MSRRQPYLKQKKEDAGEDNTRQQLQEKRNPGN
jgi:hypothetical protein